MRDRGCARAPGARARASRARPAAPAPPSCADAAAVARRRACPCAASTTLPLGARRACCPAASSASIAHPPAAARRTVTGNGDGARGELRDGAAVEPTGSADAAVEPSTAAWMRAARPCGSRVQDLAAAAAGWCVADRRGWRPARCAARRRSRRRPAAATGAAFCISSARRSTALMPRVHARHQRGDAGDHRRGHRGAALEHVAAVVGGREDLGAGRGDLHRRAGRSSSSRAMPRPSSGSVAATRDQVRARRSTPDRRACGRCRARRCRRRRPPARWRRRGLDGGGQRAGRASGRRG